MKNEKNIGYWIIPEYGNQEYYGYLLNEEHRFRLVILGEFPTFRESVKFPIILGKTLRGRYTLIDVIWQNNSGANFETEIIESHLFCLKIIKGYCFNIKKDIQFNSFKFNFLGLREWLNKKSLDEKYSPLGVNIKYEKPENIKFEIDKNIKGEFVFDFYRYPFIESDAITEIHQDEYIILSSVIPLSLEKFIEIRNKMLVFFSLSLNKEIKPDTQRFYSDRIKEKGGNKLTELIFLEPNENKETNFLKNNNLPIKFTDIEEKFNNILKLWFNIEEKISPVTNILLYFFQEGLSIKNKFILVSQAMETYHARFRKDKETYVKSSGDDNEVNKKGEPFYVVKVKKIMEFFIDNISDNYFKKSEIADLSTKIRDTRNYYTHYTVKEENIFSETDLLNITPKLISILQILILHELGIGKSKFYQYIEFIPFPKYTDIKDIPTLAKNSIKPNRLPYILTNNIIQLKDIITNNKIDIDKVLRNIKVGKRKNISGVYAFWLLNSLDKNIKLNKRISFFGANHKKVNTVFQKIIAESSFHQCLYIGKTTNFIDRLGMHLMLNTWDWYNLEKLPQDVQKNINKYEINIKKDDFLIKRNSQCQFRAGFEHIFKKEITDDKRKDILFNHIGISFYEINKEEESPDLSINTRFYLEDYAIGFFRPWFNLDSER